MEKYIEVNGKTIKITLCDRRYAGGWGDLEQMPYNIDFSDEREGFRIFDNKGEIND